MTTILTLEQAERYFVGGLGWTHVPEWMVDALDPASHTRVLVPLEQGTRGNDIALSWKHPTQSGDPLLDIQRAIERDFKRNVHR